MRRVGIMFLTSLQDKVKRIQELRRSNAAQPIRNKKKYTRKLKHKKADLK
jgi:glycyl-tRNA synthetase beta subunit